jgi:hypothetical protein
MWLKWAKIDPKLNVAKSHFLNVIYIIIWLSPYVLSVRSLSPPKLADLAPPQIFAGMLQMGCPALGIWVGFLKQPALPGEASPKKNSSKKILKN